MSARARKLWRHATAIALAKPFRGRIIVDTNHDISLQESCVEKALAQAARRLTWGILATARERSAQNCTRHSVLFRSELCPYL